MTAPEAEKRLKEKLFSIYEKNEAAAIAALLMENITGQSPTQRIIHKKNVLSEEQMAKLDDGIARLMQHEPVQYILEEAWFCNHLFYVNKNVLIPRPETEELVAWIKTAAKRTEKILDIGTGSGCIAISLKKIFPHSSVSAVDISDAALAVAQKNAKALDAQVDFFKTDILNEAEWTFAREKLDIIVSNPPYIKKAEKKSMRPNVLHHEPHEALFVEDNDALVFYRAIVQLAKNYLNTGGMVFFEINEALGAEVIQLLSENGFSEIILKKDLQQKDRLIKGILK